MRIEEALTEENSNREAVRAHLELAYSNINQLETEKRELEESLESSFQSSYQTIMIERQKSEMLQLQVDSLKQELKQALERVNALEQQVSLEPVPIQGDQPAESSTDFQLQITNLQETINMLQRYYNPLSSIHFRHSDREQLLQEKADSEQNLQVSTIQGGDITIHRE
jgi:hypothetical protein